MRANFLKLNIFHYWKDNYVYNMWHHSEQNVKPASQFTCTHHCLESILKVLLETI